MNPTPARGIWTTEFWLTAVHQLLSMLLLVRVLPSADASTLESSLAKIIPALFVVITQGASILAYIWSRTQVKTTPAPEPVPVVTPLPLPGPQAGGDLVLTGEVFSRV